MDDVEKEIKENSKNEPEKEIKNEPMNIPKDKINNLDIQSLYEIMNNRFKSQEKKFKEILSKMKEEVI